MRLVPVLRLHLFGSNSRKRDQSGQAELGVFTNIKKNFNKRYESPLQSATVKFVCAAPGNYPLITAEQCNTGSSVSTSTHLLNLYAYYIPYACSDRLRFRASSCWSVGDCFGNPNEAGLLRPFYVLGTEGNQWKISNSSCSGRGTKEPEKQLKDGKADQERRHFCVRSQVGLVIVVGRCRATDDVLKW